MAGENVGSETDYLIVGGGMAAQAACIGIRQGDSTGRITLLSAEGRAPYRRPPLSKGLWSGGHDESLLRLDLPAGVDVRLEQRVEHVDLYARVVTARDGTATRYRKLLLATGASPRRLTIPGVEYTRTFRTTRDYLWLKSVAERTRSVTLVGGGLIGLELASALRAMGCRVTLLLRRRLACERLLPKMLAEHLAAAIARHGVDVRPESEVTGVEPVGDRYRVHTSKGEELSTGGVVLGIGVTPNTALAAAAGLTVRDGIVVDAAMTTSHPDVYAAGDVATVETPGLGPIRPESEQHALHGGFVAGRNMAGAWESYEDVPFQYSEFFDFSLEVYGRVGEDLDAAPVPGSNPDGGIWVYSRGGRTCGALFWNVPAEGDAVEDVIGAAASVSDATAALGEHL